MTDLFGDGHYERLSRSAEISECGRYRYWLRRSWEHGGDGRTVCFVMLNPSTADALVDDPTIRRCMGFARAWGFSTLTVRNLFALRATNPKELLTAGPQVAVGPQGNVELEAATTADLIVAAWGGKVPFKRDEWVLDTIFHRTPLWCLKTTKTGSPWHPLYVAGNTELVRFMPPAPRPR